MKTKTFGFLLACLCFSLPSFSQVNLHFCDKQEAREKLGSEDITTRQWSTFDYEARLGRKGGTKQELLQFITEQALDWNKDAKAKLEKAADVLNGEIKKEGYNLPIPSVINLLTTTMAEEGGAGGYTRDKYIVVEDHLDKAKQEWVNTLLAHELFHVLTRNNPEFRRDMYKLIGFTVTDEELAYPADLADRRISNPDVNRFDSYATFTINGQPQDCTMAIFASKPYDGGSFFEYIQIGLLAMKDGKLVQKDGKSVIYSIGDAADFFDQVGKNTDYVINPEEILAENFSMVLTGKGKVPSQWLYDQINSYLKNR